MSNIVDLTGQRFGRLTVLRRNGDDGHHHSVWLYRCDCGNTTNVSIGHLRTGHTKSCGCYQHQIDIEANTTHGLSKTKFYQVWAGMKSRCFYSKRINYKNYGGRGITVCNRWLDFQNFYDDMYGNYKEGLEIDRIDNNGNYEPSNCRWVTRLENAKNRRDQVWVTMLGERKRMSEWRKPPDRRAYIRKRRLDGTVLIEGGKYDNTKEMQGREPLWLTS